MYNGMNTGRSRMKMGMTVWKREGLVVGLLKTITACQKITVIE